MHQHKRNGAAIIQLRSPSSQGCRCPFQSSHRTGYSEGPIRRDEGSRSRDRIEVCWLVACWDLICALAKVDAVLVKVDSDTMPDKSAWLVASLLGRQANKKDRAPLVWDPDTGPFPLELIESRPRRDCRRQPTSLALPLLNVSLLFHYRTRISLVRLATMPEIVE